jgi:UDP-N-acetylglucosamine transferase subunit ALG13
MLVVTITNVVQFTPIEENVFIMLKRVELKEQKDLLATRLIIQYYKHMKILKDKKKYIGYKKRNKYRDDMIMKLYYFKEKTNELEFTFPGYSKYDNIRDRLQIQMDDKLTNLKNKFDDMNSKVEEVLKKLT